jgi:putative transposase
VGKAYLYREVLDHVIVLNARHLRRVLQSYLRYYRRWRTHLPLMTDCPHVHLTQQLGVGRITAVPEVGGLHHHDGRRAAT